jgi:hypothetical protein
VSTPFGISYTPAIFQRTIDQVFSQLLDFGLRCNLDKCYFFQTDVPYLRSVIDANGKRPRSSTRGSDLQNDSANEYQASRSIH